MTTVRITCIVCGECSVPLDAISALRDLNGRPVYSFWHCDMEQWWTASERTVGLLEWAGRFVA